MGWGWRALPEAGRRKERGKERTQEFWEKREVTQGVLGKGGKGKDPGKLSGPKQGGNRARGVLGDFGIPTPGNSHSAPLGGIWDSPGFREGLFPVPQPQAGSTEAGCVSECPSQALESTRTYFSIKSL